MDQVIISDLNWFDAGLPAFDDDDSCGVYSDIPSIDYDNQCAEDLVLLEQEFSENK